MSIAGPAELCAMTTAPAAMNSTTLMPKCSSRMACKPARWLCRNGCAYIVIYWGCYIYVYITTVCHTIQSNLEVSGDVMWKYWWYNGDILGKYVGNIVVIFFAGAIKGQPLGKNNKKQMVVLNCDAGSPLGCQIQELVFMSFYIIIFIRFEDMNLIWYHIKNHNWNHIKIRTESVSKS